MLRQVIQKLSPVGSAVTQQVQRNISVSAPMAQQLDPIQQLFVDKIREYKTKSKDGKLVDATPQTEATLNDMLTNLERAFGAKGKDMTQFPAFNFQEPDIVWPGLSDEQLEKMNETAMAQYKTAAKDAQPEEEPYDPFEGFRQQ